MKMQYLDGAKDDDDLFDQPQDVQRAYMAKCMALNPNRPEDWPIAAIDHFIALRRLHGKKRFYQELGRALAPS